MDQSTPSFFDPTWEGWQLINYFSDFRYVVPEIFAVKVESCQKSFKILDDFLALLNFWGQAFQKLCSVYHSCIAARRLKKVS